MVEDVVALDAHLEAGFFRDLCIFQQGEIEVVNARSMKRVPADISKLPANIAVRVCPCDWIVQATRDLGEGRWIKKEILLPVEAGIPRIQGVNCGHLVRVIRAATKEGLRVASQGPEGRRADIEWESALEGGNASHLPSAEDAIRRPANEAVQARNLIKITHYQALPRVLRRISDVQRGIQHVADSIGRTSSGAVLKPGAVVNRVAPSVTRYQLQAVCHAFIYIYLQRVVIRGAVGHLRCDTTKSRAAREGVVREEEMLEIAGQPYTSAGYVCSACSLAS